MGGPSARGLDGRSLTGGFVGVRGARWGLNWDLFAGWALHAPADIDTRRPAAGMRVLYVF